jgi:UrcA family protein
MPALSLSTFARTLMSATLLGLVYGASPVYAQAGSYSPPEEIYVYGPHPPVKRGFAGAPIETHSMSQPVRFDDLDLRTGWGVHALRLRIAITADRMCRTLDAMYPTTVYPLTTDAQDCYRKALSDAMYQADDAIARARSYSD